MGAPDPFPWLTWACAIVVVAVLLVIASGVLAGLIKLFGWF
jgi:hypothetical protein